MSREINAMYLSASGDRSELPRPALRLSGSMLVTTGVLARRPYPGVDLAFFAVSTPSSPALSSR